MLELKKFIIGMQPSSKMFRISSVDGLIIDSILSQRGIKPISEEYYSEISTNREQGFFRLKNDDLGNILRVDMSNVILTKDAYDTGEIINTDNVLNEFHAVWRTVNDVLDINDVRRIGIAVEYRISFDNENVNKKVINILSKIPAPEHPGKFHLRFEDRRPTNKGIIPDEKKSDFINVIYDYYDSILDADHSEPGCLNANIDFQKYYSPLLSKNVWDEVRILKRKLDDEVKSFKAQLKEFELVQ